MGSKPMAYYNEYDPYAAEWLENLILAGLIADGVVDKRSIKEVQPNDLKGFTQCHFFAGIGVWSHSLRLAGVSDDQHVWTGSCPCQPFSAAGEGKGFEDERHLWPDFFRLIEACQPERVMGEQVASKDGLAWLDLVHTNVERAGYSIRAADTCAAGVGAPHIRQRLYWVADSLRFRQQGQGRLPQSCDPEANSYRKINRVEHVGRRSGLADTDGRNSSAEREQRSGQHGLFEEGRSALRLADTASERLEERSSETSGSGGPEFGSERLLSASQLDDRGWPCPTNGFWRDADWLFCTDGKWRPVRPETFPLVNGASSRMGRLRAYGNAINAQQAAAFIEAVW